MTDSIDKYNTDFEWVSVPFHSRSYIAAHWSGFHDTESTLRSYTISAGIEPGGDSLLPPTTLPPSTTSLLHTITPPLPTNITVYVNLVATSNAGHMTTATSDGVFIDDTPPTITNITIDTEWAGSAVMATQYSNTALRVTWNSDSSLSSIHTDSWSIHPYPGTAIPLVTQTIHSRGSDTASGLRLADGGSYSISVTSCSVAGLCSLMGASTPVLVDSTPPVDGFFAVETESTFLRNATVPGGMTWRNRVRAGDSRVNLAFYGFSDVHSGISEYWATVGTSFGQTNLSLGAALLTPSLASETGAMTATVKTVGHLQFNQTVYITLWAVNGVGLESRRVQGNFVVQEVEGQANTGTLYLLRSSRCSLDSCLGHCTCAARGDLCPLVNGELLACVEVETVTEEERVAVYNVAPQQAAGIAGGELFTAVTDKLVGSWDIPGPSPYQRLEWTVGENGAMPGSGLFDTSVDQIWREAGSSLGAVLSVNSGRPLLEGSSYVFYVRAWFNATYYTVFQSSGITVDISGPRVVTGGRLREGGLGANMDIDYSANQSNIEVTWNGVFISDLSGAHSSYQIGIGDSPGTDNVVPLSPVPSLPAVTSLPGVFSHGMTYFTTLRATSPLLVTVDTISDGFTVDSSPPEVGVVLDGLDYWDAISQSDTQSLSARWAGFHDAESGIHHYEMAWSETPIPPEQYVNVGIRLRWTLTGLSLDNGITYYCHIVAVNNAGLRSASVASNGITVDTTRPAQLRCNWKGLNITSFEPTSPGSSPCNATIEGITGVDLLPPSPAFTPLSGCYSQQLAGSLSLPLPTSPGTLYMFSFWLAHTPGGAGCGHETPLLVRVTAPGLDEVVGVHSRSGDPLGRWSWFQFQFTADSPSSILTLSTLSDQYGFVFDALSVSECQTFDHIPIDDIITNQSSVFHVSQEHISGMWTRLRVHWEVGDEEGGVREFVWAIGTTERGEQLQPFTSTGTYVIIHMMCCL